MQIIFDEKDKAHVEKYKSGEYKKYNLSLPFISPTQEKCSLELKINDPYKCAIFLQSLFYHLRDYTKENCGFEVSAVSLIGVHSDLQNLDDDLHKAIVNALKEHKVC